LWYVGYPDQAVPWSQEALTLARELAHPFSLTLALEFAATLHAPSADVQTTHAHAEAVLALSREQGFGEFFRLGMILRRLEMLRVESERPQNGLVGAASKAPEHEWLLAPDIHAQRIRSLAILGGTFGRPTAPASRLASGLPSAQSEAPIFGVLPESAFTSSASPRMLR
jgi:hypothetical protein